MENDLKVNHLLCVLMIFLLASVSVAQEDGIQDFLRHGGQSRYYTVYIPDSYEPDDPGILLIALHGGGGTAQGMFNTVGQRFNELMGETNGLVVYPSGINRRWNDGRIRGDGREDIDDVGFLAALIETLSEQYAIEQVFVAGFSNGGAMALRVACEIPDYVDGAAAVASLYAATLECVPEEPVGMMLVFGDEDPLLPIEGGDIFFGEAPIGSVLGFDDTVDLWLDANDCDEAMTQVLPDDDPDDGTRVEVMHYEECISPVTTYLVKGGGHTWPGSVLDSDEANFGRTSRDFSATTHIFTFLSEMMSE